jgi:hypothetical protein
MTVNDGRVSFDIRDLLAGIDHKIDRLDETLRQIQVYGTPFEQSTRARVDELDGRVNELERTSVATSAVKRARHALWAGGIGALGALVSVVMLALALYTGHA